MRTISGALKSTPTQWLPTLSAIAPSHLRREYATQKQHKRIAMIDYQTPLKQVIENAPISSRLKSRKPFYKTIDNDFDIHDAWKKEWNEHPPAGANIIEDPTIQPLPGFNTLPRKQWVQAYRIRSRHGRTAKNLYRWGYRDNPTCTACGTSPQDMDHLILNCPQTAIPGGYQTVHLCEQEFLDWMEQHKVEM